MYLRTLWRGLAAPSLTRTAHDCQRPAVVRVRVRAGAASRRGHADSRLDFAAIDDKWRKAWDVQAKRAAEAPPEPVSKYVLPMFPYPSGHLHLGHLRVYTIADVVARFHTLLGHRVMLPMGWDSFGLPAENAAIARGLDPAVWTQANIAHMTSQLDLMNASWDWCRQLRTSDPNFYKHTQKIFLLLYEHGLAYRADAEVNYDPVDKTVVANEQVDANGCSWRSGAKVEKRRLRQWFFRISAFREALLNDLDLLAKDNAWPERVISQQRNWLGKSTGALISFPIVAFDQPVGAALKVFTTRPDTLPGAQYLALTASHPVVADLAQKDPELQAFLDTLPGLPPDSKVGYMLPNIRAVNPLAYHKEAPEHVKPSMPVYVAPYVLGDYGEGAVMGVPGHDVRDHAFWKQHHYDGPVHFVLAASEDETTQTIRTDPFIEHGTMNEKSGPFKGKTSREAAEMVVSMLKEARLAEPADKWRLRDWLISRQRYWGTPIPIVHCAGSCGAVAVPDDQLPVRLPPVGDHWAQGRTGNPLESAEDWVATECSKCGGPARRDTDTMDTFVDSSWYYMRFIDPHNREEPFSAEKAKQLLPVDIYIGGVEHAILHLLYARFIYKFLMSTARAGGPAREGDAVVHEPFSRLVTQGMVRGKTYTDPENGRFLKADELDLSDPARPRVAATSALAAVSFEKMSKSKHNGVDPTAFIARYGADPTRAHILFQAPVGETLFWDEEKIVGVTRWLARVHDLVSSLGSDREERSRADQDQDQTTKTKIDLSPDGRAAASVHHALHDAGKLAQERIMALADKGDQMTLAEAAEYDASATVWRAVQTTVGSVTASYERVYSLNTVISDLMTLTNTVAAHWSTTTEVMADDSSSSSSSNLGWHVRLATASALVRMLAPVAPAFAEECWSIIIAAITADSATTRPSWPSSSPSSSSSSTSSSSTSSLFDIQPGTGETERRFPEPDGSLPQLLPRRQKCAVQVNGRMRVVVEIARPGAEMLADADRLRAWLVDEITRAPEARAKLLGGAADVRTAKKVLVVKEGRLVNFVL